MEGLETPAGLHDVEWKEENPPWLVPNKAWAGSLAGKTIPPGPQDPLKARFMSFEGGAGIHGIDPSEYSSIGHDASHGCVRMRIPGRDRAVQPHARRHARLHHLSPARARRRTRPASAQIPQTRRVRSGSVRYA